MAPILYFLTLAGVAAGVLFSGYSQILRSNVQITNATTAKNELSSAATTLAATGVAGLDQETFCPPAGPAAGGECATVANLPIKMLSTSQLSVPEQARLPQSMTIAQSAGSPAEVGVFTAGGGLKQLDPWGHYYVYCRWENTRNPANVGHGPDSPAYTIISAGANGKLETTCGDTKPSGDDQMVTQTVALAIQRASVWQDTGTGAKYGAMNNQITVTPSGEIEAVSLLLSGTATLGSLNLSTALPIASGGTAANNIVSARANLGATTQGDYLFAGTSYSSGIAAQVRTGLLGATTMGDYLFSSGVYASGTAASIRSTLLGASDVGSAVFTASDAGAARSALGASSVGDTIFTSDAPGGRAALGATSMGDYLFSSGVLNEGLAGSIRTSLLGAGSIGNTLFIESTATGARTDLGAGSIGGPLFTVSDLATAYALLGLTGSMNQTLNVNITGTAAGVLASGISGVVAIVNGGTGADNVNDARTNLGFSNAGNLTTGYLDPDRVADYSLTSFKLTQTGVAAGGPYNWVYVDQAGRVVAAGTSAQNNIGDGVGDQIWATASGGGYLYFQTASVTQMTLSPAGYLGLGTLTPGERLHVNDGNIRVSGASGTTRELQFATGTNSKRWVIEADAASEGSNGGSDFEINRYNDAGAASNVLTISRATGNAVFAGTVAATGGFVGNMTGTFSGTVTGSVLGSVGLNDGTITQPSLYFLNDTNMGLYRPGGETMAFVTSGVEALRLTATQSLGIGTTTPRASVDIARKDAIVIPAGLTTDRPTTGAAGMMRFNSTTSQFEGYDGTSWSSLASTATGMSGQSMVPGWPDIIVCSNGTNSLPYFGTADTTQHFYRPAQNTNGDIFLAYNSSGQFTGVGNNTVGWTLDCATNAWTIAQLVASGKAFNIVNGGGGAASYMNDGTAGAPGLYFTADPTTGIYRPTTGTIGLSTSGIERLRVTASGNVGLGTLTPAEKLDIGGAIKIASTTSACDAAHAGTIQWTGAALEYCNGSAWGAVGSGSGGSQHVTLCAYTFNAGTVSEGWATRTWAASDCSNGVPQTGIIYDCLSNAATSYGTTLTDTTCNATSGSIVVYDTGMAYKVSALYVQQGAGSATSTGYLGATASATAPSRADDLTTGLFSDTASTVSVAASGTEVLRVTPTGANLPGATETYGIAGNKILALPAGDATSVGVGAGALGVQTATGAGNTAVGAGALGLATTGTGNTVLGRGVGSSTLTTGSGNILIGTSNAVDVPTSSTSNWLNIGNALYGNLSTGSIAIGTASVRAGAVLDLNGKTSLILPAGLTTDRPGTGIAGMIRFNTTTSSFEGYNGSAWGTIGSGGGASSMADGTAGLPGWAFTNDLTTGFYRPLAGTLGVSTSGIERLRVTASGSVGIGTLTPSYSLEVNGGAKVNSMVYAGMTTGTGISGGGLPGGTTGMVQFNGGTALAGDAAFFWDNTNKRLGLGTSTPRGVLDAGLAVGAMVLPVGATTDRPGTAATGMIRFNTTTVGFEGYNGTSWGSLSGGASGSGGQSMVSGWPDAIVCTYSGVSPLYLYHASSQSDGSHYYKFIYTSDFHIAYNSSGAYSSYTDAGGLGAPDCVSSAYSISYLVANGKAFNFVNGSASGAAAMADGTAAAPGLYFAADTNTGFYRPAADNLALATGGIEALRVTASGYVGIGTTTPTAPLTVSGIAASGVIAALSGNSGTLRDYVYVTNTSTSNSSVALGFVGTTSGWNWSFITDWGMNNGNNLAIYNSGSSNAVRMYFDGSGNVGIGTTTPQARMDVVGPSGVTSFTGTTALGLRVRGSTANTDYSGIDFSGNGDGTSTPFARMGVLFTASGSKLQFGTSNSYNSGITNTAMTIDPAGNVGIGTTSPTGKLHAVSADSTIAIYGASASGFGVYGTTTSGNSAVKGESVEHVGVWGISTNNFGVQGNSTNNVGVTGASTNHIAIYGVGGSWGGWLTGTNGVYGGGTTGFGVQGASTSSYGVYGESTSGSGVGGVSTSGYGVYGKSTNNWGGAFWGANGVYGNSPSSYGVQGINSGTGCSGWLGGPSYSAGGNCTTNFSSDARLKKDITTVPNGLDVVMKLRPVSYLWKADGKNHALETDKTKKAVNYGFIAQEVMKVLPDLVTETPPEAIPPTKPGEAPAQPSKTDPLYGLDYNGFIAPTVKAVQELNDKVEALGARLDGGAAGAAKPTVLASGASAPGRLDSPLTVIVLAVGGGVLVLGLGGFWFFTRRLRGLERDLASLRAALARKEGA